MRQNIVSYKVVTAIVLMTSITIPGLADDCSSKDDNTATCSTTNELPILENPSVADIKRALGIAKVTRSIVYSAAPSAVPAPALSADTGSAKSGFGTIIEFDSNSTKVIPSAELKTIAEALKDLKKSDSILIEGHTDSKGNDSSNKKLALKRANAIRQWLEKNGVPRGVVKTRGVGEEKPIADNNSDEGRRKNRRVEFTRID